MANVELAKLLLRRKELQQKVDQLKTMRVKEELLCTKVARTNVTENVDHVIASVPIITAQQLTAAYDDAARKLRITDAFIQKANWETKVETGSENIMDDYVEDPKLTEKMIEIRSTEVKKQA
jgi:hypothetical protein